MGGNSVVVDVDRMAKKSCDLHLVRNPESPSTQIHSIPPTRSKQKNMYTTFIVEELKSYSRREV